jgi:hypothetical protein
VARKLCFGVDFDDVVPLEQQFCPVCYGNLARTTEIDDRPHVLIRVVPADSSGVAIEISLRGNQTVRTLVSN